MHRLRPGRADDRGFTTSELLVTMVVLSILMTMLVTLVTTTSRTFTRDRSATDSTNIAAIGMNELTRVIRSGTEVRAAGGGSNLPVFTEAGRESLTLHAFIDADSADPMPVKVRFWINGNRELVETRYPAIAGSGPHWQFVAGSHPRVTSRVVTRQITPRTGSDPWLFTYYADGAPGTPLVMASGGLTEAQRKTVARVGVRLVVQADLTDRANPVVIQNEVGIPNLGIDRVGAGT